MAGVLTTLGLTKYNAAVANKTVIKIAKIIIGSNTGNVSSATTSIGTAIATLTRVNILAGFNKKDVSFRAMLELDVASWRQVGIYDDVGDLIAAERIYLDTRIATRRYRFVGVTLTNLSNPEVFDSDVSYPQAVSTAKEIIRMRKQAIDYVDRVAPQYGQGYSYRWAGGSESVKPAPLVRYAAVATNAAELALAKNSIPSMTEIFNTWYRFSHSGSVNYPALPAELNGWSLNAQGEISSTINSSSYIGFVSPTKHSNFELDVQVRSSNGDDDAIGIVIAFLKEDGREFTISAVRTLGGWFSGIWKVFYNANQSDALLLGVAEDDLYWGDGVLGKNRATSGAYVQNGGWNRADIAAGTRIRVTRNGDIITAETSNLGHTELVPSSKITINLASLPILSRFRKPASYGYSSLSQANSFYNTTSMVDKENVIVDMTTNTVLSYDGTNWINTGATLSQTVGVNQFVYSKVNKSTYYVDSAGTISRVI